MRLTDYERMGGIPYRLRVLSEPVVNAALREDWARFGEVKTPEELAASKEKFRWIGCPAWSCLYFLYDEDGELIYIGKASSLWVRLRAHRQNGKPFTHYATLRMDRACLDAAETFYVEHLNPPLNRAITRSAIDQDEIDAILLKRLGWKR